MLFYENRKMERRQRNRHEISEEATTVTQERNDGSLDQKHGDGGIEKLFDSEYILNIELLGCVDILDIMDDRKRRVKDNSKGFVCLRTEVKRNGIY